MVPDSRRQEGMNFKVWSSVHLILTSILKLKNSKYTPTKVTNATIAVARRLRSRQVTPATLQLLPIFA
jgi:hypothetical protein